MVCSVRIDNLEYVNILCNYPQEELENKQNKKQKNKEKRRNFLSRYLSVSVSHTLSFSVLCFVLMTPVFKYWLLVTV